MAGVAGFDLLTPYLGKTPGSGVKGQAALLAADLQNQPQIYADGIYIIPHANGTTAIGSTSENTYTDATKTDRQLDDLIAKARNLCPPFANAPVLQRWAGLRPKALRRDPMLGPIPGLPNTFAALGAFKIGFGLAHKVGALMADYASDKQVDLPTSFTVEHHLEHRP